MQINYVRHPTYIFIGVSDKSFAMERTLKKAALGDFDPQTFLTKVGEGRAVLAFRKNET